MKVATMRTIDAWAGTPLCAFFTFLRRLAAPFRRSPTGPIEKILFVKLAEQGSTVLAYPAMERAVRRVGVENVYFLVFEENRDILDAMQVIPTENVIPIRTRSLLGTAFSSLSCVRRLRKEKFDAAVDLEFFARSTALLTWLSGAKRRVGLHAFAGDGPWRGDLMTHRVLYNPHVHTSSFFDLLVRAIDEPSERFPAFAERPTPVEDLPRGRMVPSEAEVGEVEAILREATGQARVPRIVLLNANCGDLLPLRKWEENRYVTLARRLLDADPELWIAFTGAPSETAGAGALVDEVGDPRCISLAGKTTMRQLLVLYGLAQVLVTNDSGPAHFASLTPIDVVTLFGPETPELFGVVSDRSHLLWARTACSPCVSAYNNRVSKCRENVCMQAIGVDEAFETTVSALERRAAIP